MSSERHLPPSIAPERSPAKKRPAKKASAARTTNAASSTATQAVPVERLGAFGRAERIGEVQVEETTNGTAAPPTATATAPVGVEDHAAERSEDAAKVAREEAAGEAADVEETADAAGVDTGPRRVRLAVSRVDPWSIMKLSFLLSVAVGIMIVVATAVVWYTLDGMAVFTRVNDVIATLASDPTFFDLEEYAAFDRVISLATMVAVVDIVLLTALATIGAFLYNITAALVGGINLTLTDD